MELKKRTKEKKEERNNKDTIKRIWKEKERESKIRQNKKANGRNNGMKNEENKKAEEKKSGADYMRRARGLPRKNAL